MSLKNFIKKTIMRNSGRSSQVYLIEARAQITEDFFHCWGQVTSSKSAFEQMAMTENTSKLIPQDSLGLLKKKKFILFYYFDSPQNDFTLLSNNLIETDEYGLFNLTLPLVNFKNELPSWITLSQNANFQSENILKKIPVEKLHGPLKILISDFDKTLCETQFSSAKDLLKALKTPLINFKTIAQSLEILKKYQDQNFQSYILSASPHFFKGPMKQWAYQNKLVIHDFLLKDYRQILTFGENSLTLKDMKNQGLYKLNQIINLLTRNGAPSELVLMGDIVEADLLIYSLIACLLTTRYDPWNLWQEIRELDLFLFNETQDAMITRSFHWLAQEAEKLRQQNKTIEVQIYIRLLNSHMENEKEKKLLFPRKILPSDFFQNSLHFYSC
jgi:phosphatidate phosphatase APP1